MAVPINASNLARPVALAKPNSAWQYYRARLDALAKFWGISFWNSLFSACAIGLLITLLILIAVGGAVFWASQFYGSFFSQHSNEAELALAQSGINNVKKMVGDDKVWALAIQPECRFGNKTDKSTAAAPIAPANSNAPRYANYTVDYSSAPPISQSVNPSEL